MANEINYVQRYIDILFRASQDYPNYHTQKLFGAESSCVSRIRSVRNWLLQNPQYLVSPWDKNEITNLRLLNFWAENGLLFAGSSINYRKQQKKPDSNTGQLAATLAAKITKPITLQDAKALIYVLERQLITLPIQISNPDKEVLDYILSTVSQLENTATNFNEKTNQLILI